MARSRKKSLSLEENSDVTSVKGITVETHEDSVLPAIPQPGDMAEYERILPGFADRVIAMAEKQQNENIEIRKQDVEIRKQYESRSYKIALTSQLLQSGNLFFGLLLAGYGFYLGLGWPSFGVFGFIVSLYAILKYINKK